MKHTVRLRSFLALSGSALLAITAAQADILYWDGATPAGDPTGGAGTWDTSTENWDTALTGGSASAWIGSYFAIFGTPAGIVNLGAPITTSGMQFNVHSYTINASSTNTLTFASGNNTISTNFTSAAGNVTSINGQLAGTGANLLFAPVNPASNPVGHIISFGGESSGGWTGTTTIDKNMIVRLQNTNQALLNTSSINLRGGTLLLTNIDTQNTLNRVRDTAVINSYGGNIRTNNTVAAVAYSESLGQLKLHGGNTTLIQWTNQNSGGSQLLSFSSITREAGSFATMNVGSNFGANNVIRNEAVSTATTTGEIIGAWMITGNGTSQSEYAQYNSSGHILAYVRPGANSISAETSLPIAWLSTANMSYTGSPTLTVNRVMNTLRTAGSPTWQLADYSLATNGLLAGGGNLTISTPSGPGGGTGYLTAAGNPGGDNAIYINSGNGFIAMGAPVKDNGNAVTMVLTTGTNGGRIDLNAANTHTGGTVISAPSFRNGAEGQTTAPGQVSLFNANSLGPNTTLLRMESGTLNTNAIAATVGKFEGFASSVLTGTGGTIFTVGNGTAASVTGDFAGSILSVRLTKTGNGTQILSGTNTANNTTAQYTVNGGTLQFAKTDSFFAGTVAGSANTANWTKAKTIVNSGATLAFNVGGAGEFTTGHVTTLLTNLTGSNAAGTEGFQAGSRIGFDTTNATGGSFTVGDVIADSTGAGGGAIGLTKLGTGTLVLDETSNNTYTGATNVNGGTLLINGDNSAATGAVTVASGATLGGFGNVGGNATIQSGGYHAPGDGIGNQDFAGNLTYNSGSIFSWEIDTVPTNYDSVTGTASGALSGVVSGPGAVFNIASSPDYSTGFWNTNQTWTEIFTNFTSSDAWNSIFTSISGADLTWDGTKAVASTGGYFTLGTSSLDWTAAVIPEPTSALAGLLLGAGLLRRRRK